MDTRATRMGSGTLGYGTRSYTPLSQQPQTFWGSVPPGVKTILKVAVVAVVAYAALTFLAPTAAYVIGSAVSGIGSAIATGINATLAFFGISTAAATSAAAAGTVSLGAGTAAVAAGATTLAATKTATISASSVASMPSPASIVPDLSSSVTAIDPSQAALLSKKSVIASNALDLADAAHHVGAEHTQMHDISKVAKLGHEAVEIHEASQRHAPSTRDHISQTQQKAQQWADRVAGHKDKSLHNETPTHASNVRQRESTFATELNADRERLEQTLGGPSV